MAGRQQRHRRHAALRRRRALHPRRRHRSRRTAAHDHRPAATTAAPVDDSRPDGHGPARPAADPGSGHHPATGDDRRAGRDDRPAAHPRCRRRRPPAPDAASVEAIIREIWPDDLEERALAIAKRESKLNPSVHNWCCYGVFAIYFDMGKNFLPQMGITSAEQLFDARTNITAAYKLYTLAGWDPWAQTDPGT